MKKFLKTLSLAAVMTLLLSISFGAQAQTRVAALKGPTGMGMAHMMLTNTDDYAYTLSGAPDEITGGLINGSLDIAAVPTNVAAVLYNKTQGGVKLLALNTLGVLYILEKGDSVHTAADLAGKTIIASGQGATPEYVLDYVLSANDVQDTTVEWRSEHSEVTAMAGSGMADIVLLPEPHVTALLSKDASYRVALDMTQAFADAAQLSGREGAVLSMGCVVVRTEFLETNPQAVAQFMADCEASINFTSQNPDAAAEEIAQLGILANAQVAKSALPNAHIVFIAGEDMRTQVAPLFEIWFEQAAKSIGGALPAEDFYVLLP